MMEGDPKADRKTSIEPAPWDSEQPAPLSASAAHKDLPLPCADTVEAAREFDKTHSAIPAEELEQLTGGIIAALKTVFDPEIPVDIYELGLIYKIDVDDERNVDIEMTLTAPACPVAGDMPNWVENAVSAVPGVNLAKVKLVFTPPWEPSRMSEEAQVALNMF
jgi:FeS assembly SUF system protein